MADRDRKYDIGSVTWTAEGIAIQYMTSTDVRVGGHAMAQHVFNMHGAHPDYAEDIDKLHDRVERVLRNALEDFEESDPWVPELDDEDEDEERGMGE